MTNLSLWKIKYGKRQVWEDWCREVREKHQEEGVVSIIEEDLVRERCVIFGEGDRSYVVYEHTPILGKVKKPFNPDRELNRTHIRIFEECLERADVLRNVILISQIGYDLIVE